MHDAAVSDSIYEMLDFGVRWISILDNAAYLLVQIHHNSSRFAKMMVPEIQNGRMVTTLRAPHVGLVDHVEPIALKPV